MAIVWYYGREKRKGKGKKGKRNKSENLTTTELKKKNKKGGWDFICMARDKTMRGYYHGWTF